MCDLPMLVSACHSPARDLRRAKAALASTAGWAAQAKAAASRADGIIRYSFMSISSVHVGHPYDEQGVWKSTSSAGGAGQVARCGRGCPLYLSAGASVLSVS